MTGATLYPFADHKAQWFANRYPGDVMPHPNVIVIHTTEGSSWPTYDGGAVAPTFTVHPTEGIRQHFPVNASARGLINTAGGVETNTLNVVQIELVGTCVKGGPGVFWPEADSELEQLAALVGWLSVEWPIPLVSTDKPWLAYPGSYGSSHGQRMSFSEWDSFSGICGHQHVPENYHGDPGDFPVERLIEKAKATPSLSAGGRGMAAPVAIAPVAGRKHASSPSWDGHSYPGRSAFRLGKSHPAVVVLGQRLVAHGFGRFYKVGPGPTFGPADVAATAAFQRAQGWSGGDADGYPGPETWRRLLAAPAKPRVSLRNVDAAAHHDAPAPGRPVSHGADVKPVEEALAAEGFLAADLVDGSFGTSTVAAYKRWQEKLGYRGSDADGYPGRASLSALGHKHGFDVVS